MTSNHLHGLQAIAAYMNIKPDAARHLRKAAGLPLYNVGKTVSAERSDIVAWLAEKRAAGLSESAHRQAAE